MSHAKTIMKKRNSYAEAGYTKQEAQVQPVEVEQKPKFRSMSEELAQSDLFVGKWMFPEARTKFPDEPWMRYVDKYFPYAKGGPLLIDEPRYADDLKKCERKAPHLYALGFRYVVIKPQMTMHEAVMELERCQAGLQSKTQLLN